MTLAEQIDALKSVQRDLMRESSSHEQSGNKEGSLHCKQVLEGIQAAEQTVRKYSELRETISDLLNPENG